MTMKNTSIIISCLLLLFSKPLFASHLYGGYILASQQQPGRLFQIEVVVLSDAASVAEPSLSTIMVSFGDGTASQEVTRVKVEGSESGFQKNIYQCTHLYNSDGQFVISIAELNLVDAINNINNGNTNDLKLVLGTMVNVNSSWGKVSTPKPLAYALPSFATNGMDKQSYNPTFSRKGNDSLIFSLVGGEEMKNYWPNYTVPAGLTINKYSGMLTWKASPLPSGRYLIAIRVDAYKMGRVVSTQSFAQFFLVKFGLASLPDGLLFTGTDVAPAGWYRAIAQPDISFTQDFSFNRVKDAITYGTDAYSEVYDFNADTNLTVNGNVETIQLNWLPTNQMLAPIPYFVTYRITNNVNQFTNDYEVGIYLGARLNSGLREEKAKQQVMVLPNPVNDHCLFTYNNPEPALLQIFNVTGQLVFNQKITNNYQWQRGSLSNGIYQYVVQLNNGKIASGKIILE